MGLPAATGQSVALGTDIHIVMVPTPGGPVPAPLPHLFIGQIDGGLISAVKIGGSAAAVVGSTATNSPSHFPTPPGTSFQRPPANKGTVFLGSTTVRIGGKAAARLGDMVMTCNDPADMPMGRILTTGTVMIG